MKLSNYLQLYFIAGAENCHNNQSIEQVVSGALRGGATLFQFREKGDTALGDQEKLQCAMRLKVLCRAYSVPLIINDDAELMVACGADGLHIGQDDGDIAEIRSLIGNEKILGVSVHSLNEAVTAVKAGADYLGIGPIYPTSSKRDAKSVLGTGVVEQIRKRFTSVPIVGVGGIRAENAKKVIAAGADGVGVISAISGSCSPYTAASNLWKEVTDACAAYKS
ncbi:thiamine phosphate synthase [Fictibacillus iocasae]|uniref:Thiamine-phosphate synthase n=1 Tax=Fictibacillus iocasae TaxID=2715437 RepID=A0ABW2NYV1_9BACL